MAAPADAAFKRALSAYGGGRVDDAANACLGTLKSNPRHGGALNLLAVMALNGNQPAKAVELLDRAVEADPRNAEYLTNRGGALLHLGRHAAAADSLERALARAPGRAEIHENLGDAQVGLGHQAAAVARYEAAIAIDPRHVRAQKNRGVILLALAAPEAALESLKRYVELAPCADAHYNRGNALFELRRYAEALADYEQAVALAPSFADAQVNRGNALFKLKRVREAVAAYDAALDAAPRHLKALENRGTALRSLGQYDAAAASYDAALALDPAPRALHGMRLHARLQNCDWRDFEPELERLGAALERGEAASSPFCLLGLSGSAALQRRAAEAWVRQEGLVQLMPPAPDAARASRPAKIHVGYFSADFREHPVALLIAELIERHDRSRFEVTAFSFGPDTGDAMRRRLVGAFDRFIDVRGSTDADIVATARRLGVDIAVDLGGFTDDARPGIFARRAAPLQVSYLGYLGTLGAPYMDYLIADATLVPAAARGFYAEKLLYLPSYQANDSQRPIAERTPSRAEVGLPEDGVVFCCFNANYKITPMTFDGWMRILAQVHGSSLFLLGGHPAAADNLRREAGVRGIDLKRLVFGPPLPPAEYRARYRVADLFLDTLPYNAGTTASDALWAGTPVLTCPGEAFASRMAASLLESVGLPELIARDAADYERRAVELAADPDRLAALKAKLAHQRRIAPLFDSVRFARTLEDGYTQIHDRHLAGLPPDHVEVADSALLLTPAPAAASAR